MSEWIKCSDQLPEDGSSALLALANGDVAVGWINNSDWNPDGVHQTYDGPGEVRFNAEPTHWMKLPNLPTTPTE